MTTTPCAGESAPSDQSSRIYRSRVLTFLIALVVIAAGLGSRRYAASLPSFIASYTGDTMWALLVYLLIGMVWPRMKSPLVALLTAAISLADEVSQLCHAAWIDALRRTWLGGIVLGFGFLWSDLVCYAAGIGIGIVLDCCLVARRDEGGAAHR